MRVFVYEHLCGGGLAGQNLPPSLLAQGTAMLRAVIEDFYAAGIQTTATADARLKISLPGAQLHVVNESSLYATFDRLAAQADASLVIAPEFDGILERMVRRLQRNSRRNLGSSADAIALCSDKLALSCHLLRAGIPTPPTAVYRGRGPMDEPLVIKPRFGVGCEDTFVCENHDQIQRLPSRDDWIMQPLVQGMAASVSLIVHGDQIVPLLAGQQFVRGTRQLHYMGGRMPLEPDLAHRAIPLASRAVAQVPGLQGFVGVDLVLGEGPEPDSVIEINPRLTLSYLGLQRLSITNLARAMLDPEARIAWSDECVSFDAAGTVRWEGWK